MNSRKNLFIVASALLASSTMSFGQLRMGMYTTRTYRQNPADVAYRATWTSPTGAVRNLGTMSVAILDGTVYYNGGCALNGSPTWFGPAPLLGCETGATGYLVAGDLNLDGNRDDFSHWEVTSVIPAVVLEPLHPELCSLYSAPPSRLPRPLPAFIDDTLICYFNTQTEAITEYKISTYRMEIPFETRIGMDQAVVTGRYEYAFPRLNALDQPRFVIPVNYYPLPEGYAKHNSIKMGFRFTKLNDKGLAWTADGFIPLDPRLVNHIEWEGNSPEYIYPSLDIMYFSIPDMGVPAGNPNRNELVTTLFPGFQAPGTSRVLLPSPLQTGFYIPAGFIPVVNPAREGIMQVTLQRYLETSPVAADYSTRTYQLPCRFVNTYEGWAAISFPAGTPANMRAPSANPDGDLYTNYIEWRNTVPGGFTSNPMVKNTIPPPVLTFVAARSSRSSDNAGIGHWETSHTKTEAAYPPIAYEYETSTDMVNWTVVSEDNPDWLVIDSETEIKVQSRQERPAGTVFLRVKSTQAPEPPPTSLE